MRTIFSKVLSSVVEIMPYTCSGFVSGCWITSNLGPFLLRTEGPCMEPTFSASSIDVVLSERISARYKNFQRGHIVIAKQPENPKQFICKRITGLPGDKMKVGSSHQVVPIGHVWLEGDNSEMSYDSRMFGPVPQGLIFGRVICIIWPIKEMKMLWAPFST